MSDVSPVMTVRQSNDRRGFTEGLYIQYVLHKMSILVITGMIKNIVPAVATNMCNILV